MIAKLGVLGGSSPFTASLVDALVASLDRLPPYQLVLHGRSKAALALLGEYAERRLTGTAWQVAVTTELECAITGADVVIHQIRYGDLELRARGEALCSGLGVAADETLGPAAMLTALHSCSELTSVIDGLTRCCSAAWILNLTNPLSWVTELLSRAGLKHSVGLCELPWYTLQEACRLLICDPNRVGWSYTGVNHYGFITRIRFADRDILPDLPSRMGQKTIGGIDAGTVIELEALPLKYFTLLRAAEQNAFVVPLSRSSVLSRLREEILCELRSSLEHSPPSLQKRYMEWYPQSVVPMLAALSSNEPTLQVVNIPDKRGFVREQLAEVSRDGIQLIPCADASALVRSWLRRFESHQRAFALAIREPTEKNIRMALQLDPIIPDQRVAKAAVAVLQEAELPGSSFGSNYFS